MSKFPDWPLIVDEARDRLSQGIAEDVEDCVEQLLDEGLIDHNEENQLRATLNGD
jgi:uncharacterized protein YutE (UPF0331/DUF86 family)